MKAFIRITLIVSAFVLIQTIWAQDADEAVSSGRPYRSLRRGGFEVNNDPDPIENEFERQNRLAPPQGQADDQSLRYGGRKRIRHGFHPSPDREADTILGAEGEVKTVDVFSGAT